MKNILRHIIFLIVITTITLASFGQRTRYVQLNSIHALSVPEHDGYSYEWNIVYGVNNNRVLTVPSRTNVTHNITWSFLETYHVTVTPILDSVGCYGEPVKLDIIVVQFLSLKTFDDIYYTPTGIAVSGNVGDNDFDETDANIFYNPTPVTAPENGTLELFPDGSFNYTPIAGFTGVDVFVYEAFNDHTIPMYSTSKVTIVVQNNNRVADLSIVKTGPEKALFGDEINYTIVVHNNGPDMATNVVVEDLPTFGLFSLRYSLGTQIVPMRDKINVGNIAAGDSAVIYLFANVSNFSPGFVYNEAITYSDIYDSNDRDNESIWTTEISAIYVDLPGIIYLPSCETRQLPGNSEGNNSITRYEWLPVTGLSNPAIPNPVFFPDETTIGRSTQYVLRITDTNGNTAADTMLIVVFEEPFAIITGDTLFKDIGQDISLLGNESIGEGLDYFWWSDDGNIISFQNRDSIRIDTTGTYYLRIIDQLGCEALDSAVVLLMSHPPLAANDSVSIVAGTDSTINVLVNDSDINNFDLHVSGIATPPNHSSFTWDEQGNFTITPDADYWRVDSIEYRVCNNGYPVQCSTAWIIIDCVRPPLNADVVIEKTGDAIAFWGDTIRYNLRVYSNGPDTATVTTITDVIDFGLVYPEYSLNNGTTWLPWTDSFTYTDSLRPGEDVIDINIRALVRLTAERTITNTAFIETDIIENVLENDTSTWVSKIKTKVLAIAGRDTILGVCNSQLQLDGSASTGENLTYLWVPSAHLNNARSATPLFSNPGVAGTYTYRLTVTDDDDINATDELIIEVLPPPVASAGVDRLLQAGKIIQLDGSGSSGQIVSYLWTTTNGHIISGTQTSARTVVDETGLYRLTVTDRAGCTHTDEVNVFPFYYQPFAIPDYYSLQLGATLQGNVLANDYDPNGQFQLSTAPGVIRSSKGGTVIMQANGDFTYSPPAGFNNQVDDFVYEVCSNMPPTHPNRCSRGYVRITVNQTNNIANLHITKEAVQAEALILDPNGVEFLLTIENLGPAVANNVWVTDSLSRYLLVNHQVSYNKNPVWSSWSGATNIGTLAVGQKYFVGVRGTAADNSPARIHNAATVAAHTFDNEFAWTDVHYRNVDTASVAVSSDLLAVADMVEMWPGDPLKQDNTIGPCDNLSYLTAERSRSNVGIDSYQWSPANLVTNPNAEKTTFTHALHDTTITFVLTITAGEQVAITTFQVNFSPEVIADAGPDRKKNQGEPLVIDATNSQGADARYEWYKGGQPYTIFEDGNVLRPIVYETGVYELYVTDKHGCYALDNVTIRENDLFSVSDIVIVIANDTVTARVSTNDYDPDGDNINYTGVVFNGPYHGRLLDNPPLWPDKSALLDSNKVAADGTFIYVPNRDYVGFDYFTYEVCDDNAPNLCVKGIVYIKVVDVKYPNSPPIANHDHFFVNRGNTLYGNVLENDYDLDGGIITMTGIVVQPTKGSLSFEPDGSIIYSTYGMEDGFDTFVYSICDNGNPVNCDTASVTIQIHKIEEENQRPVAVDDAYFSVDKVINGNVLRNDYDPNGDPFAININPVSGPENGIIRFGTNGSFTYVPNPGFEGTDQVVYQICETRTPELYCSYATLYITNLSADRYLTDVAILKTGPAEILSGSEIEYAMTITIEGPTLANDIVISDTIMSQLTNQRYSFDRVNWLPWQTSTTISQMMLYADTTVYIRANIPDIFSGSLINTGYINHRMDEVDLSNNQSEYTTGVFQMVIANAGVDVVLGACLLTYELDGSSSLGVPGMKYNWYPPELLDNPNSPTPLFTTEAGESQEFVLVVSSILNGVADYDTAYVTVVVDMAPVSFAGDDVWPETSDPVFLDGGASTGIGPLTYSWWRYDEENNVVVLNNSPTLTVERSGDYYLTITDKHGCTDTDMVHVGYPVDDFIAVDDYITTWQQTPVDIFVLRNDIIDDDDQYNLELLFAIDFPRHGELIQNPLDSMFTYIPEPYYFGPDSFVYVVSTKYFNDQATVYIEVVQRQPVVPDGFSPNGDGKNDYLLIEHIELYEKNSLVVFNRWGNIVYQKQGYSNDDPWDGVANRGIRIGNGALPTGVYFYVLDLGDDRIVTRKIFKNIYIASDNRR